MATQALTLWFLATTLFGPFFYICPCPRTTNAELPNAVAPIESPSPCCSCCAEECPRPVHSSKPNPQPDDDSAPIRVPTKCPCFWCPLTDAFVVEKPAASSLDPSTDAVVLCPALPAVSMPGMVERRRCGVPIPVRDRLSLYCILRC